MDFPAEILIVADFVDMVASAGHKTGDGKVEGHAYDGPREKQESTADAIDLGQHDTGGNKEDDILNGRGIQRLVSALGMSVISSVAVSNQPYHSSHLEDVHDVIHGHVSP